MDIADRERLVQVEDRAKSNTKRIDEHDNEIEELKKTYSIMEKMNYRMENMEKSVISINEKLDKHEQKIENESIKSDKEKGKKWDKFIDYVFYSVIAVILLLLYTKLGLK